MAGRFVQPVGFTRLGVLESARRARLAADTIIHYYHDADHSAEANQMKAEGRMKNEELKTGWRGSQLLAILSRSEKMMVAVGFIPRMGARNPARRGATPEDSPSKIFQSSLRDEAPIGLGSVG